MTTKIDRALAGRLIFPKGFGETQKFKALEKGKRVAGFDTEADAITAEPFLLTYCSDNNNMGQGSIVLKQPERLLDYITSERYQQTINFFFNLQYDYEGILKLFKPEVALAIFGNSLAFLDSDFNITYDESEVEVKMSYIPKKAFHIKYDKGAKTSFYDLQQYYQSSLKNAAKKYLPANEQKDDDFQGKYSSRPLFLLESTPEKEIIRFAEHYTRQFSYDKSRMEREISEMTEFFSKFKSAEEYRAKLIEYAIQDAKVCKLLGEILVEGVNKFVNTRNMNSSATISEYYFRSNNLHLPKLSEEQFKELLRTYFGGRFEITKRGAVDMVSMYDIKSAYPFAMTEMPILSTCPKVQNCWRYNEEALFAGYCINVNIPTDLYLSPLPVRDGLLTFPVGRFEKYWVDKLTLELLMEMDIEFTILKGIEIFDDKADFRLKVLVEKLYKIKEDKANEPEVVRFAAKIILNALYGKFIQLIDDTLLKVIDDLEELDYISPANLFNIAGKLYGREHTGDFKTGKLFAPQYASFITAHTRAYIYRLAQSIGLEKVVGIHTDSLMIQNAKLPTSNKLGGLEMEMLSTPDGKKVKMENVKIDLLKCGFYQSRFDGGVKIKSRGVGKVDTLLKDSFEVNRRYGLKQAIKKNFDQMNVIMPRSIDNNINADAKRKWHGRLTLDQIRNGKMIDSSPLVL